MGQRVTAIVYGAFLPRKHHDQLTNEDGEWLKPFPKTGAPVETHTGKGKPLLGFTIAVQNVWEERDGEVEMPECPLYYLKEALQEPLKVALPRWKALAAWAAAQGVTLAADLLIVEVERA